MTAPTPQRILILGATSQIAEAIARLYAADGARFMLAGRRADALAELQGDLTARGAADVFVSVSDLIDTTGIPDRFNALADQLGGVDLVLLMYAAVDDQMLVEAEPARATALLNVNLVSQALWALSAAAYLEKQRFGILAAGGALAGDRGRRSNYVYGAGKAGLTTLIQGIAHRLHGSGARACIIKFGPIASPLTYGQRGSAPAEQAARAVKRALTFGSAAAFYVPWWWRLAMWPIRLAPDPIMHRTRL